MVAHLPPLPCQPLRHTLKRIRAGGSVGPRMDASRTVGRDCIARAHLRRPVGMIEIMKCARIDHYADPRAAAFGARDHVLAILRRRHVIGGADQDQGWHAGTPGSRVEAVATGIERDRGSEVGLLIGFALRADSPQHAAAAVRPAEQRDVVRPYVGLLAQPPSRRIGIGDPLAVGTYRTVASGALAAEPSRA